MKSCYINLQEDLKKEILELRKINEELNLKAVQFEISMVNVFFLLHRRGGMI